MGRVSGVLELVLLVAPSVVQSVAELVVHWVAV